MPRDKPIVLLPVGALLKFIAKRPGIYTIVAVDKDKHGRKKRFGKQPTPGLRNYAVHVRRV